MTPALAPPARLGITGPPVQTPLVYVGCGHDEIGLFDVVQGGCHQVLRRGVQLIDGAGAAGAPVALGGVGRVGDKGLDEHLRMPQLRNPTPGSTGYDVFVA